VFLAPIAIFATVNWVHIPFEEAKMRRQFGEAYDAYASPFGPAMLVTQDPKRSFPADDNAAITSASLPTEAAYALFPALTSTCVHLGHSKECNS
jgi:hypothetical protein